MTAAWADYRAVLDGPFNGAEAVRRAASSEFLKAALGQIEVAKPRSSEQFRTLIEAADYFAGRLLADDPRPSPLGCFGALIGAVPMPEFLGSDDDRTLVRKHLSPAYTTAVQDLETLLDPAARFIPDGAPQPLVVQVASNIDGATVDRFARFLNGISVCLRRIDEGGGKDPWAHANLADLTWAPDARTSPTGPTVEGAIHPMLPAISDGRAPMFIEYEGFPFASTELLKTRVPDSDAAGARVYRPFYRQGSPGASGFARVPRLAYGRTFQSFAFVTSNAGTLPIALQEDQKRPWMPRPNIAAPSETTQGDLIATAEYSRRTAIGQSAVSETRTRAAPLRIGAPIAGVVPLASDYPRIGVFADGPTAGAHDLFRESDGHGALVIGSPVAETTSNTYRLTDIRWTGTPKSLTFRFFDGPASEPGQPGATDVTFEQAASNEGETPNKVDFARADAVGIAIEATRDGGELDVTVTISCAGTSLPHSFKTRSDALWLRLVLRAEGSSACMTFADVGATKPDGIDAPLLLMAPGGDRAWNDGLGGDVVTSVHSPRVGYLDFERWFANSDLRKRTFGDLAVARRFEDALLAAYVMRHLDAELAAALDRLPDPAVERQRLEFVVVDQVSGAPTVPKSATFELAPLLRAVAAPLGEGIDWTPDLLKTRIFREIEARFRFTLTLSSSGEAADLDGTGDAFRATTPAGHVARLSIDALVPAQHFETQGSHPAVFERGVLHYAARHVETDHVAFPSAALRIETMLAFTDEQKAGAIRLAGDMILARPVEQSRRYDIVTMSRLPDGADQAARTRFWRLIGEVDVASQRWRPSGRPIYNHVAPRDFRLSGGREDPVAPAVPLQLDAGGRLARFENEAFFDRPNIDAQTITQKLLPLPSGTVLQQHVWDAPSATYFRHRFTLRSRYAGALRAERAVQAWKADARKPVTAWTLRVAMLADLSRILLTRPQLRALIPLTTAPGADSADRPSPPVLGILQEPPFARGGLADRIDAEIKTGFGYGFEADDQPVEIRDSRKEIGPSPQLGYRPMDAEPALGMTLMAEGPAGLTFDQVGASAPSFPNSLVTLFPLSVEVAASSRHVLEEHFLGVALRRHIDPEWTAEPSVAPGAIDAERCWWMDVALQSGMAKQLLRYTTAGVTGDLLLIGEDAHAFVISTLKLAVDGQVAGAVKQDIEIARLRRDFSETLSILHQPLAPGRYSVSVYVGPSGEADTIGGRSTAPLMLASFEWSPPRANKSDRPAVVTLIPHATAGVRAAMASAPTFLAWTRTSRDFDFVHVVGQQPPDGGGVPKELVSRSVRITHLVAVLTPGHEQVMLKRSGSADGAAWLTSSTFLSEYPLHLHRHLAVLTTRYLDEPGRPVETYCRSAVISGSATALTPPKGDGNTEYPAEDCVRIVEFETPAAILCGSPATTIPQTYCKAYFDLVATGFDPQSGGAIRLLLRLIGSAAHLRQFKSLMIVLTNLDNPVGSIEVQLNNNMEEFTKAIELKLESSCGLSAVLLRSNGHALPAASNKSFKITVPSDTNPGLFMKIEARGGTGEFWADISLLHSHEDTFPNYFDFKWLFGTSNDSDPAVAIAPQNLLTMIEAQARIVSVSPPISIVSHESEFCTH